MKINLKKAIFINRAPIENLELDFYENEIAVLTAINGKGKTTVLSHIVDAFYEMARPHFSYDFENKENKYYRISSSIFNLKRDLPAFVYFRFQIGEHIVDYVEVKNICTEELYNSTIRIDNKIPFNLIQNELESSGGIKKVSSNFDKKMAEQIFNNNILTYFPYYRFEAPGYINDPYKVKLSFKKEVGISGSLNNPIEVISGLPHLANWIMDIILDLFRSRSSSVVKNNIDMIMSLIVSSKGFGNVVLDVGNRNLGGVRLQIGKYINLVEGRGTWSEIYPTIFNLSSGESSMLCLFGELLRQADNNKNNISLNEVTGIVLIDEVDKHLHIKLQKEILPKLFKLFPNVQFILSSHSPFLSMGLAEILPDRSKIVDLDSFGISKDPTTNELYTEVYEMMISENDRFKSAFESINSQIEVSKKLQIITEGKNTEYIEKTIEILDQNLLSEIKIIKGSEDRTGDQQLKNAFEILSQGNHASKFLFIWDCDSIEIAHKVTETQSFKKFCFEENTENSKSRDMKGKATGIENLFSDDLFNEDVYDLKMNPIAYGGFKNESVFNKRKFLDKVKQEMEPETFKNFLPLIFKIKDIINSQN